jgi:hypothetical protein
MINVLPEMASKQVVLTCIIIVRRREHLEWTTVIKAKHR